MVVIDYDIHSQDTMVTILVEPAMAQGKSWVFKHEDDNGTMQSLGAAFDELGLNFNGLASGVNVNVNINFVLDECSQGAWDFCIPNGEPFLINNDSGVSEQSVELGAGKQSITVKLRLDNVKQVGNPKDWGDYFHAKLIIYAMQKGGDIVYQSQDPKIGIGGTRT